MIHCCSASTAKAQTPEINYPPRAQITFNQHAKITFHTKRGVLFFRETPPPPKTLILNTISPNHTEKPLTEKSQQITALQSTVIMSEIHQADDVFWLIMK